MSDVPLSNSSGFLNVDQLDSVLQSGRLGAFTAKSPMAACLLPLLNALKWKKDVREVAEALPHFADTLDMADLRNVMARLGYKTTSIKTQLSIMDERLMPCLMVPDQSDNCLVLLERDGEDILLYDGAAQNERLVNIELLRGTLYFVSPDEETKVEEEQRKENWMGHLVRRFKKTLWQLFWMTFTLNLLVLAVPLFVMSVYDQVVPSKSLNMLEGLGVAIFILLIVETALRTLRSRIVAFMGGRMEYLIATNTFKQILSLPASYTEGAPLSGQVSRLREFDTIREVFTGPLISVVMELPFVILFIGVIGWLGGWVAAVPLAMVFLYAITGFFLVPKLRQQVARSSRARAERHSFLVEMVSNMRTIKEAGAERTWLNRYRNLSAEASYLHFETSQTTFLFQTIGQAIMTLAGLCTIAVGVFMVMGGVMTIGGLIASMALVWRVLTPLQSLFLTFSRFEQIKVAIKQINQLMKMQRERDAGGKQTEEGLRRNFAGALGFLRVSFRYQPTAEPALLGVNFRINPGETIAITGPNGAGKSTILRLILGMHSPQAGQVNIDGMDIRQINPIELRQAIAYVPQTPSLFHGTIAQNLRLANPVATDDEMEEACEMAGVLDDIMEMEEGFDTRVGDHLSHKYSAGVIQKLHLAQAYIKDSKILLLDEAAQTLDDDGDKAFMTALEKMKGTKTIILVSHRPSHLKMADKLIVLQGGLKVLEGAPEAVLERLSGKR